MTGNIDDLKYFRLCQTSGFIIGVSIFNQNKRQKMIAFNDKKLKYKI